MSEWQPIDTAPRDGTEILLFGACGCRVGYFDTEFNDEPYGTRPYSGWWSFEGEISPEFPAWRDLDVIEAKNPPTHWMPLPEPPDSVIGKPTTKQNQPLTLRSSF